MTQSEADVGERGETPQRREDRVTLRLDPDDWAAFDAAVKSIGYRSRNAYIDDVLAWVLRKPGARTPRRPPAHDGSRPE